MRYLTLLLALIGTTTLFAQTNPEKVDYDLWQEVIKNPEAQHYALVVLREQVDSYELLLEMESSTLSREDRGRTVVTRLQDKAGSTQPGLLKQLHEVDGLNHDNIRPLWIVNGFIVFANKQAMEEIATWDDVDIILGRLEAEIDPLENIVPASSIPDGTEPGLRAINAPFMWNLGYTGYGQKILVMDSGNDPNHPALKPNFWGLNVPVDEAWNGSGFPEDCSTHGTHVAGTCLGLDRQTNDTIGVAFNSRWMGGPIEFASGPQGCDAPFDQQIFTPEETFQWALNPDGNPVTTSDQPEVINCSWGTSANFCSSGFYINLLNNLEAAGIAVVWSAGNSGPGASTITGQKNLSMTDVNTFSVGAINGANSNFPIASFSSRGPSTCGGSGSLRIKPEVVAPGVNVRSSSRGGGYVSFDGTSMASPHVAGAVALLAEAFPNASGTELKRALYYSAIDLGPAGEDNAYGNGMIDLQAAYQYMIIQGNTPTAPVSAERDAIVLDYAVDGICNGPVAGQVLLENAGSVPFTSITFNYGVSGGPQDTWTWSGNLQPDAVTVIDLPGLNGIPAGQYEFFVVVTAVNGQQDPRDLNNIFRIGYEKFDAEYAQAEIATQQPQPVCANSRVAINYTGDLGAQDVVEWYSSPNAVDPLATGNTFLTPPITSNTTYYVSTTQINNVGQESATVTTPSSGSGLRFNAHSPFLLRSVKVYAPSAGGRFIRLVDQNDDLIVQRTVIVQEGEQRIDLNIQVPAGVGHRLLLGSGGGSLGFTAQGVSYPYEIPGVVTITGGSPSSLFYNYFFDWEVSAQLICGRTPIDIFATGGAATPVNFSGPDTLYLSQGNTAQFTDNTPGASNQTWDFGNGTTGSGSTATATYNTPGDYVVTLFNRNSQGCNNAGQRNIHVTSSVSAEEPALDKSAAYIFPNPTGDVMYIGFEDAPAGEVDLAVFDLYGRQVLTQNSLPTANGILETPVNTLPGGMYMVQLRQQGQLLWFGKFAVGR